MSPACAHPSRVPLRGPAPQTREALWPATHFATTLTVLLLMLSGCKTLDLAALGAASSPSVSAQTPLQPIALREALRAGMLTASPQRLGVMDPASKPPPSLEEEVTDGRRHCIPEVINYSGQDLSLNADDLRQLQGALTNGRTLDRDRRQWLFEMRRTRTQQVLVTNPSDPANFGQPPTLEMERGASVGVGRPQWAEAPPTARQAAAASRPGAAKQRPVTPELRLARQQVAHNLAVLEARDVELTQRERAYAAALVGTWGRMNLAYASQQSSAFSLERLAGIAHFRKHQVGTCLSLRGLVDGAGAQQLAKADADFTATAMRTVAQQKAAVLAALRAAPSSSDLETRLEQLLPEGPVRTAALVDAGISAGLQSARSDAATRDRLAAADAERRAQADRTEAARAERAWQVARVKENPSPGEGWVLELLTGFYMEQQQRHFRHEFKRISPSAYAVTMTVPILGKIFDSRIDFSVHTMSCQRAGRQHRCDFTFSRSLPPNALSMAFGDPAKERVTANFEWNEQGLVSEDLARWVRNDVEAQVQRMEARRLQREACVQQNSSRRGNENSSQARSRAERNCL